MYYLSQTLVCPEESPISKVCLLLILPCKTVPVTPTSSQDIDLETTPQIHSKLIHPNGWLAK